MKILVIDDDALILKSLSHQLTQEGYSIMTATDGAQAHDFIDNLQKRPDLILCDLLMPGVSGLTFISLLRNFHNFSIPVIVMSSLERGDLLSSYAGIHDVDFIAKPFAIEALIEKIKKYDTKPAAL